MRVIHVVSSIAAEAAGPSYSVRRLCEELREERIDAHIATLAPVPEAVKSAFVHEFPPGIGPRKLGRSPAMLRWLREQTSRGEAEILHSHLLWMMPNVYPAWAVRGTKCKLIISPRGTMSECSWNRSKWKKKPFWWLLQRRAVMRADAFVATSEQEFEDIRRLGFRQPVAIIPNGIDIPQLDPSVRKKRQVLFLSRIHPIKNIPALLKAWKQVQDDFADWELIIAGPDETGHLAEMKKMAQDLGLRRYSFPGPLYGEEKWRAYQQASLFVLPTHTENFGMVVAEALAAGTPAIVSKGTPWQELERKGAGWWIDNDVETLSFFMRQALGKTLAELKKMGERGSKWMLRDFSWNRISLSMASFYAWLSGEAEKPAFVMV